MSKLQSEIMSKRWADWREARGLPRERRCERCGESLLGAARRHNKQFCSIACRDEHWKATGKIRRGENHPSWIGDAATPRSKRSRARLIRLREAPDWCERCGFMLVDEVHHRNEDPLDNSHENLEYLCMTCHHLAHRGESVWDLADVKVAA